MTTPQRPKRFRLRRTGSAETPIEPSAAVTPGAEEREPYEEWSEDAPQAGQPAAAPSPVSAADAYSAAAPKARMHRARPLQRTAMRSILEQPEAPPMLETSQPIEAAQPVGALQPAETSAPDATSVPTPQAVSAPSARGLPPTSAAAPASNFAAASGEAPGTAEAELSAIRAEGLTARQLRMAMRVATRHGIRATTGYDAVRMLRHQGIDPFDRATMLDLVTSKPETGRDLATTSDPSLPKAFREAQLPESDAHLRMAEAAAARELELLEIRRAITQRRRKRTLLLMARLAVFVGLPTLLVGYYFYFIATPLYATNSEFVIQQADMQQIPGGLGGLFAGTGLATSQDSVNVQSFLQSRDAMHRLDEEEGFKAHFTGEQIDPLRRLTADSTDEAAYRLYQRHVKISYDPTEGIIRMEVIASTPEASERFARALVSYAEEQVDQLTQRLRANQMRDAQETFDQAEIRMTESRLRAVGLQERFSVISSEVEVQLIAQQIITLEAELTNNRLNLQELMANVRPNAARVLPLERRIENLQTEITSLRSSMTQGSDGSTSLARIQSELVMAEADVQTRQLLLAQALQQMESARVEANRQVRYLSMGVRPSAPDEPTYPRALENTALAFFVFGGIYLMLSMTAAILREQVAG
jgi:capsular polysaccharide transport system permease protein